MELENELSGEEMVMGNPTAGMSVRLPEKYGVKPRIIITKHGDQYEITMDMGVEETESGEPGR